MNPRCTSCSAPMLSAQAKYCHECGTAVPSAKFNPIFSTCTQCGNEKLNSKSECRHCAQHNAPKDSRRAPTEHFEPRFQFDFNPETIMGQIKRQYFGFLRKTVQSEQGTDIHSEILDRFYHTDFIHAYTLRANQWGDRLLCLWDQKGRFALPEIDQLLVDGFERLTDFFLMKYCTDLMTFPLPKAIQTYEQLDFARATMPEVVREFLDFSHEQEVFFFDLNTMPTEHRLQASKNFLTPGRDETVFFVCDLSLKSNCKDGFALTDKGIYWKQLFHKAQNSSYRNIKTLEKKKDGLYINGHYFTANPSLDLKLYKLLKLISKWEAKNNFQPENLAY